MSEWSPASLSPQRLVVLVVAWAVVLAYAVLVRGSLLAGLLLGLVFAVGYFLWRFLVAVEAIASAQQHMSRQREREQEAVGAVTRPGAASTIPARRRRGSRPGRSP